jgi:PGF-CTERM protein
MALSVVTMPVAAVVDLSASGGSATANPGDTVDVTFDITNDGDETGEAIFTVNESSLPSDFSVTDVTGEDPNPQDQFAVIESGNQVTFSDVDAGETVTVTATVDVPGDASTGDYTLGGDLNDGDGNDLQTVDSTITVEAQTGGGDGGTPEYAGGAVLYDEDGTSQIEVPFTAEVGDAANQNDITLLEGGDEVADSDYSVSEASTGRVLITGSFVDSATASDDIEVDLNEDEFDNGGEQSVAFAANSFDREADFGSDVPEFDIYQGTTVAVYNAADVTDFAVEGDDSDYFQSFASGTNSEVFYVQTEDLELDTYEFNGEANFTVRDLNLQVEMDELNVTTEDSIEGTVSARASDRPVTIELVDDEGDTVDQGELNLQLGGQSEVDFEYDVDGINLDTGEYTVEVTDDGSGVVVESSTITVSEEEDDDAEFSSNTITEERGDILELTVEMEGTDFASITFGSEDDGVVANATVEDDNGDGEVTVYLNTFRTVGGQGDVYALDDDSDDAITDQELTTTVEDLIDAGNYDIEVSAGEETYADDSDGVATVVLEERGTENLRMWTGASTEIDPSDLEDVNEAIADGEISQSSEIAVGDLAVHQLQASGFEGALDARENEDVTGDFVGLIQSGVIDLTLEESDPGANQDAQELAIGGANTTVIADGPNDTYFVIVDTGAVNFADGDALPADEDTGLEANFTVIQDDANTVGDFTNDEEFDDDENEETIVEFTAGEPDVTVSEPFNVSQASGQTITGTTNIAPGSELDLRIRSDDGVSPSFLKTASPVVQSDGTFSATFDFSEQNVGDSYEIVAASPLLDDDTEEDGTVVESVATATPEPDTATPEPDTATPEPDTATPEPDTATPEPDTDTAMPDTDTPTSTPTSTPGFGVVVALTALLAAALLAVRRD